MNSWRTAGLLSSGVAVVADLMLRWEILRVDVEIGFGPGFISMSPARRRRKEMTEKGLLVKILKVMNDRLKKNEIGIVSRHLHAAENGNGW